MRMGKTLALAAFGLVAVLSGAAQDAAPARQMNVTQGPETVFDRPPAEILPALAGATPTGENGRVGADLVFWGFRYGDGRQVFFFACPREPTTDCATRVPSICPAARVLETREASGNVVRRSCRTVAIAGIGDTRPGCADRLESTTMDVGLVACGG